jgi:hypothetical protein
MPRLLPLIPSHHCPYYFNPHFSTFSLFSFFPFSPFLPSFLLFFRCSYVFGLDATAKTFVPWNLRVIFITPPAVNLATVLVKFRRFFCHISPRLFIFLVDDLSPLPPSISSGLFLTFLSFRSFVR